MVLVMDTFRMPLCMSLVVAMSMESLKVDKCIRTSEMVRYDVIYFYQISICERQSAVTASPFVIFQQLPKRAVYHWVSPEPLYPVDEISIIGTCRSSDLDMTLNGRARVFPEGHFFCPKCPPFSLIE